MYTGSLDDCAQACASDMNCVTAQYSEINGYCYLKSTMNGLVANDGVDTVDCDLQAGTIGGLPVHSCGVRTGFIDGRLCTQRCNVDRPGGDYNAFMSGTVIACARACAADDACVSAQFLTTNNYCYMKNVKNDQVTSSIVDTIDCQGRLI